MDQHEDWLRIGAVALAKLVWQPVVPNIEYVLYRARLSVFEATRMSFNLSSFERPVIWVEDKRFYYHMGASIRAMVAAMWRLMRRGKRSGGSTITQQLVRTLLLQRLEQKVRRKVIEILLAMWIERHYTKEEILRMYVCAVRYEKHVLGITEACRHFFARAQGPLSSCEVFFLVERVANIRSQLLGERVAALIRSAYREHILQPDALNEYMELLNRQIMIGNVKDPDGKQMRTVEQAVADITAPKTQPPQENSSRALSASVHPASDSL